MLFSKEVKAFRAATKKAINQPPNLKTLKGCARWLFYGSHASHQLLIAPEKVLDMAKIINVSQISYFRGDVVQKPLDKKGFGFGPYSFATKQMLSEAGFEFAPFGNVVGLNYNGFPIFAEFGQSNCFYCSKCDACTCGSSNCSKYHNYINVEQLDSSVRAITRARITLYKLARFYKLSERQSDLFVRHKLCCRSRRFGGGSCNHDIGQILWGCAIGDYRDYPKLQEAAHELNQCRLFFQNSYKTYAQRFKGIAIRAEMVERLNEKHEIDESKLTDELRNALHALEELL